MSEIGKKIIKGLQELVDAVRDGTVLQKFRVTKVIKNEDGTYKQVNKPK